ncbi:hypothetical protein GCM10007392_46560 [Saccharospirillum salsuginis]|uniref:Uncharacterized protein n=1 Tax=Saccharospirillum salsuginis TaxID=418750 RepID=A0A918KS22_9GAMM|nr:hypothetical protein GCM10007392_46560 [Saccharospirillum salsuginis]
MYLQRDCTAMIIEIINIFMFEPPVLAGFSDMGFEGKKPDATQLLVAIAINEPPIGWLYFYAVT